MEHKKLGDIATYINGYAFKPQDRGEKGLPIIRIQDLTGNAYDVGFYDGDYPERIEINDGDILISWSASLGVYIWDKGKALLNQHIFKVTPNEELVDFDYFYFLMKYLKPYFTKIATNKQTTGLGHVTLADIKRMNLIVPDVETQKRIVSVIKPIDDKIKLNNDINNNLVA